MTGSSFFRVRMIERRAARVEAGALDDFDGDGDAEAFDGLDERAFGEAFLFTGLGFSIFVSCSVKVADSSDTCGASAFSALAGLFLVVALAGAGGSSLRVHSPSSLTLKVYQSGVSSIPSSLAIVRKRLYSCNAQCTSLAASN